MDWNRPIPTALGTTARRLASYLFCFPNQSHRRDKILELFWNDADPNHSRTALNNNSWQIRELFRTGTEPQIRLQSSKRDVRLELANTNVVDIHRFRNATLKAFSTDNAAVDLEALDDATCLYTAPFLEESDEDWVLEQRELLQSVQLRSLTVLMNSNARKKHYENAIMYARRILASDPTRETVQRALMLLYVLNGQRAEAIRQFERCRKALRDECGADPMPETRALLALIRSEAIFQKLPQLIETEFASVTEDLRPPPSLWSLARGR